MVQWRGISQEGMRDAWEGAMRNMEEEVLEKYKVDGAENDAYKGRGEPLEWRIVKKGKDV